MQTTIYQYVRKKVKGQNQIVGVLMGSVVHGVVHLGWSKANLSKNDVFDKEEGLLIASGRLVRKTPAERFPCSMKKDMIKFVDRCKRYYRTENFDYTEGMGI